MIFDTLTQHEQTTEAADVLLSVGRVRNNIDSSLMKSPARVHVGLTNFKRDIRQIVKNME